MLPAVILIVCAALHASCDGCEFETALLPVSVTWAPAEAPESTRTRTLRSASDQSRSRLKLSQLKFRKRTQGMDGFVQAAFLVAIV